MTANANRYDVEGNVTGTYALRSLAAEYSSQAATSACATQTCYPVLDHLGSGLVT
jgi:hypothetical protein